MAERHKIIPASFLILMKDNKILLLRRANTGFEDGNYSFIAGHVDPQESFKDAIIREAKEEANIDVQTENLNLIHIMHRLSNQNFEERVDAFFVVEKWNGELKNMEPHKCDDLSWFDLNNLPENIIPYIKEVLNNIKNKISYSEFGWKQIKN